MQNEESLVQRAQRGDQDAIARLYEGYFDRIYRYIALRVGSREDAEDITEQVFLRVLESIGSFKWRGIPFAAWLFRIAHNQVIDHLRKTAKGEGLPLDESKASAAMEAELLVEQKLDIEQLLVAVKHLTEAQQEVISLRFAAGLSIAETARAMGRSEGAIKALQHSALVALRKRLVERR